MSELRRPAILNNFLNTLSGIKISSPFSTDWGRDDKNSFVFNTLLTEYVNSINGSIITFPSYLQLNAQLIVKRKNPTLLKYNLLHKIYCRHKNVITWLLEIQDVDLMKFKVVKDIVQNK